MIDPIGTLYNFELLPHSIAYSLYFTIISEVVTRSLDVTSRLTRFLSQT